MSAKWNRKFEKKVKNTKIKKRRKTEFPVKKDFFGIEKGSKKLKEIKKNSFWIFNYFVAKNKLSKNNPSTDWNCVKIHPSPNWNISNRIQYFIKVLLVFIRFDWSIEPPYSLYAHRYLKVPLAVPMFNRILQSLKSTITTISLNSVPDKKAYNTQQTLLISLYFLFFFVFSLDFIPFVLVRFECSNWNFPHVWNFQY